MLKVVGHRIYFRHNIPNTTECHIEHEAGGDVVGLAMCSKQDNYSKSTGRKVALARAMKIAGWEKSVRVKVWNAYHIKLQNDREMGVLSNG